MSLQKLFLKNLREKLEEQKKQMIEESVEEYRQTLEATLSEVVDSFIDNLYFSVLSSSSAPDMGQLLELRVTIGGIENAQRDSGQSSQNQEHQ